MITPNNPPLLPCPVCGQTKPISDAKSLPFCSERCRLIDLGRWLSEEHALPATSGDEEEDEPTDSDSPRLPPGWHDA